MNNISRYYLILSTAVLCVLTTSCISGRSCDRLENEPVTHCQLDRSMVHEGLSSTLWVQTSAEYRIHARRVYKDATAALTKLLADPTHTAATEQQGSFKDKPPAIIMDIDETVLDNSPFQAQLILDGTTYSEAAWKRWTEHANANWVPGAKDFIDQANSLGVAVFLVTNRSKAEEDATRENFISLNHPIPDQPDYLLTKQEQPDWTSDKSSRRAYIAQGYRIVMLIGDDLNDFVSARSDTADRHTIAATYFDHFGTDWFLLPNPAYGYWERALYQSSEDCDAIHQKRQHLTGFRE